MQKQKKKLYKKFLLTRSQERWASYKHHASLNTLSLRRSPAVYKQIEKNDEKEAQILDNHFHTVYTRERSLLDVGLHSHTQNDKIEYVQILCNDVKKILNPLKKG